MKTWGVLEEEDGTELEFVPPLLAAAATGDCRATQMLRILSRLQPRTEFSL